jgi:uncharacterized protein YeaO (DUF488 family)
LEAAGGVRDGQLLKLPSHQRAKYNPPILSLLESLRMARVRTKRIYEPKEPTDGTRLLVMRLWPRGIRKSHVDGWLKELGAELPLIRAWKGGRLSWPEFRRRYLAGLKKPAARAQLRELRARAKKGRVTILCSCPDESRCHRGLLKRLLV